MLSKDTTVINGMIRTKDSLKVKDTDRVEFDKLNTLIKEGRIEVDSWIGVSGNHGIAQVRGTSGKLSSLFVENIPDWFKKKYHIGDKKTKDQENYKVYWVNHNYYSQEEFNTLEEARKYADSKSFEYRIDLNGRPVASGGSLRGFRMIDKKMKDDDSIEVLRAKALKKALADFYKDIKEVDSPSTIAGAQALTKSINLETDVNKLRRIVGDAKTKDAKTYTIRSDETNKQIYRALLRAGFKEHKDFAWIIDEALPDKLEIYNPKAQTIVEDYI
jgi:hypothetical protein